MMVLAVNHTVCSIPLGTWRSLLCSHKNLNFPSNATGISSSVVHPCKPSLLPHSASDPIKSPFSEIDIEASTNDDSIEIEIKKVGKKNRRVIWARVQVDAELETVWGVLTDYEGLADFIPGLAISQLVDQRNKFARLYQVGQQDLALGLKFNAKGIIDCYEGDTEMLPSGRRREIEFKMVDGDFQTFNGKWSIEQTDQDLNEDAQILVKQEFQTTLSYVVELEPKLWLPVQLLEGRLCNEVKSNLAAVREEAQRVQRQGSGALPT
ncbi:uncharacterized protein [Typha latifolia]|uniref:uncharacterized protein isoform X1 n=1 Tax=Typha latifolia TaxID=4733 RepID=UPI003C2C874D